MTVETIVFLGPSLSLEKAKAILPNACYHRPARCGDIFKLLTLKPKCFVIIDGLFEQTASVWHKEILFALEQGVVVIGAASMGALRASELDQFGMIGVGDIYAQYRDAVLIGDDEVSLPHIDATQAFSSRITPLVNVRVTLKKAIEKTQLTAEKAEEILQRLKVKPYYLRQFDKSLTQNHYIDQKEKDAIAALAFVSNNVLPKQKKQKFNYTIFTKRLYREVISEPFDQLYDWLPDTEKQLVGLDQTTKLLAIDLAKFLHVENVLSQYSLAKNKIQLNQLKQYYGAFRDLVFDELNTQQQSLFTSVVEKLSCLMAFLAQEGLCNSPEFTQQSFNEYRSLRGLNTIEKAQMWTAKHHLTGENDLNLMAPVFVALFYLIEQNRFDTFYLNIEMDNKRYLLSVLEGMKNDSHV